MLSSLGMTKVFLALGSNVGDVRQSIDQAIQLLSERLAMVRRAPLYVSKAVGYTDQADFINTAISGETNLSPDELFAFVKQIEEQVGRVKRFQNGPREIDIDIIFYGDALVDKPDLIIPHPRFAERDFVLQPLQDIDPDFVDPRSKQTIKRLLSDFPTDQKAITGIYDENQS